ncbi:MAG: hypothetical protein JWR42_2281 [Marmoricola sp.]|nr:hypothetical protein [Marmoricola sp.]
MHISDLVREAEIQALDLLGYELPDVLQRLVRVAATVSGASGAEINVVAGGAQHTLASAAGGRGGCDERDSFCAKIVRETERQHVVPDARLDPRFAGSSFVTGGHIVTYAATQLVTSTGVPIGTLCVFDPSPREVDDGAMGVMAELGEAVMEVLESRRQFESLHDALSSLADGTRELRRSNEHLAAFAGQVSHDVQGPLAAVLMALQLLREEQQASDRPVDADTAMLVDTALSGAQRMRATVSGLMDVAVLGGRLRLTELDMDRVLDDVLVDLATRRGRATVVAHDLPPVWGDDVQVRAVTQNLVANALKYAGDDATIVVSGSVRDGVVRISVADDGPGVPLPERESVFGLMVRGQDVEGTGVDGLGIGLATCRRIIEAHGGVIGVGDSVAGGADFWFELPLPSQGTSPSARAPAVPVHAPSALSAAVPA